MKENFVFTIANYSQVDFIAAKGNAAHLIDLDVWLMQWFSSSDGLKSFLLDSLNDLHNRVLRSTKK